MRIKNLIIYAFAGAKDKGGEGMGIVPSLMECISQKSTDSLKKYSSTIRKKITQDRIYSLYKREKG